MKSILKKIITQILEWESRAILAKYKPKIIAITGSVGKTSTKDAIYTALRSAGASPQALRKSQKSFNSEFGVPLTIIGVEGSPWSSVSKWLSTILMGLELIFLKAEYPKTLILEVGADHPGDIRRTVRWLRPHVSVLNKISKVPVHVEFFNSPEDVAREKIELLRGLRKGGTAVLLADDDVVIKEKDKLLKDGATVVTFGITHPADVSAGQTEILYEKKLSSDGETHFEYPTGIRTMIKAQGLKNEASNGSRELTLPEVLGVQHVYPVLAAVAVASVYGVPFEKAVKAFDQHEPPQGRMNIIPGNNDSVIIDDSYNASPDAMEQALTELARVHSSGGRKIASLGDMLELGKHSVSEHFRIGEIAAQAADVLIVVGMRAKGIAQGAQSRGMDHSHIHHFEKSADAAEYLAKFVRKHDVILVKGSQSIRMERVVKALMKEPARARDLLVRYDSEWLARP